MKKLLLTAVLTLALATFAQAADFRVTPYLQHPTMDGMTVLWLSETPEPGSIEVAGVGTFSSTPVLADKLAYHPDEISKHFGGVDPGTPYLHRVRVDGLSPGTTYDYTVRQVDSAFTGTMKTAPRRNSDVRFIVYADSETEPESTGKTRRNSEPFGNFDRQYWLDQTDGYMINIQSMASRNPDFIAIAGDIGESGNEQRDWDEFWEHNAGQYNDIAGSVPIFPAVGNHENHSGGDGGGGFYTTPLAKDALARYRAYFETPDNGSGKTEHQDRYYRVDYGPITYITIDGSNGSPHQTRQDTNWYLLGEGETSNDNPEWGEGEAPDFNPGSTQYQWLEEQLADAQKKSRFTFVQFHHSPYSVGPHGFNPGEGGQSNGEDMQSGVPMRVLTSLFKKYGVDAVFAGHDEMYEHSLVDGVHFFDIGIGGDGLRGPYMGEDGKFELPSNNSYQLFLAHLDAPEIWSGNQLTDGGKHYGHLEVNVTFEAGEWRAEVTPGYVFPMMDESGEVIRDSSGRPLFERRIYDDVTLMNRAISDLDDDGDTDRDDIAIIRQHLRQPAENCPNCDIDGDGSITILDARKIVRMCTR
ncbi:MAG: metallophosphoesterase, partial [Desulfosarcina sp.]|nr:metallophosphoesterase [Desulfobacterales bacterium]